MGIQVFIRKSAVEHTIVRDEVDTYDENDEFIDAVVIEYYQLEGVPTLLRNADDYMWCDANHWGDVREPLLAYLKANNVSDDDWYEA
jgi:hypothetical protein